MGSGSEDDEEQPMGRPAPRATRRQPKVDFHKLDAVSLQRYRKSYKLGEAPPTSQKEDLIPAVARHFASQVVDEDETLLRFAMALRKSSQQTRVGGGQPLKKPRNGPMVKPKPQR